MFNVLKKIINTGMVTEKYNNKKDPKRYRGLVTVNDASECEECQACRYVCPVGAIRVKNGKLKVDHKTCIFCGKCIDKCFNVNIIRSDEAKMANFSQDIVQEPEDQGPELKQKIRSRLGRALKIRHLDIGSCGRCNFQSAANRKLFDLEKYCIEFVDSPTRADILVVTGGVTRNLSQALKMTYNALPGPKLVMAVGACAAGGQSSEFGHPIRASVASIIPVDVFVPGCPPTQQDLIYGLILAVDKFADKRTIYSMQ